MDLDQDYDDLEDAKEPNYLQILEDLKDPTKDISISAYYILSDMPADILVQFKSNWPQIDEVRRTMIARNMADISEDNFQVDFSPLAADMLNDKHEDVRLAALDILWDSDKVSLIDPVLKIMQDDTSTRVRSAAAASLGHYLLMAQWGELSSEVEDPITEALINQITNPVTPLPLRRAALESVSSISLPEIQTYIRDAYESGISEMEISAIFAMGRSADPMWLPIIQNELDNSDTEMRSEAAKAAGIIGDSSMADKLAEIARYDDDLEIQIIAVSALGLIGNEIATNTLSEMAEEVEEDSLLEAIEDALEEMAMLGLDLDLSIIDWEDEEDEEDDDLPPIDE